FTFSLQSVYAQQSEKEIIITQGQNIEDSLSANSVHSYKLQLEKEQFVLGSANQVSVDVVVKIYNPKGDLLNTFDTPARGKEFFYFNTKSAGVFSIVVEPYEKEEGQYSIE